MGYDVAERSGLGSEELSGREGGAEGETTDALWKQMREQREAADVLHASLLHELSGLVATIQKFSASEIDQTKREELLHWAEAQRSEADQKHAAFVQALDASLGGTSELTVDDADIEIMEIVQPSKKRKLGPKPPLLKTGEKQFQHFFDEAAAKEDAEAPIVEEQHHIPATLTGIRQEQEALPKQIKRLARTVDTPAGEEALKKLEARSEALRRGAEERLKQEFTPSPAPEPTSEPTVVVGEQRVGDALSKEEAVLFNFLKSDTAKRVGIQAALYSGSLKGPYAKPLRPHIQKLRDMVLHFPSITDEAERAQYVREEMMPLAEQIDTIAGDIAHAEELRVFGPAPELPPAPSPEDTNDRSDEEETDDAVTDPGASARTKSERTKNPLTPEEVARQERAISTDLLKEKKIMQDALRGQVDPETIAIIGSIFDSVNTATTPSVIAGQVAILRARGVPIEQLQTLQAFLTKVAPGLVPDAAELKKAVLAIGESGLETERREAAMARQGVKSASIAEREAPSSLDSEPATPADKKLVAFELGEAEKVRAAGVRTAAELVRVGLDKTTGVLAQELFNSILDQHTTPEMVAGQIIILEARGVSPLTLAALKKEIKALAPDLAPTKEQLAAARNRIGDLYEDERAEAEKEQNRFSLWKSIKKIWSKETPPPEAKQVPPQVSSRSRRSPPSKGRKAA